MAMSLFTATAQSSGDYEKFRNYFEDAICTELKPEYAAMNDEQLCNEMNGIPQTLINIALKIKNNTWEKNEKEFRIAKFKPRTNPKVWENYLDVYTYSLMPAPTGITGNYEYVLIFVGDDVPEGVTLSVSKVAGNDGHGFSYNTLQKGLNRVQMPGDDVEARMLFLEYYVDTDTTATSKKLADYPEITLHIEGGHVNGYFDITRHDDAYWRELLAAHKADSVASSYKAIQVMGEKVMFHMTRDNIAAVCPNTITDVVKWWDELVRWQHELMGVDKYYDRWNDIIMARNGVGSYMYATQGYTYYENSTLSDVLPWKNVLESPGRMWGPAHEIGHVNQGAINMVGCTEVSNNLFANAQIFRAGISTTRGTGVSQCIKDFTGKVAFPLRSDVFSRTRMYLQLYLYFHAAGKDKTFYPRLFEALRQDRLIQGYEMSAVNDQIKFAEKCCEIAQMDLSEFFDVWGFFEPMDKAFVGDYANYYVTLTKEEAEASRRKMQQYEKKGGHLIFIEDRIKPSPRTDGATGYRMDFNEEVAVGKMGDTGQWEDYIDERVKATGYYFVIKTNKVEILKSEKASGALGFKLYDAKSGELLSFSNTYSISIPAYAYNREYKVVAAQADGSDVELTNAAESDEEPMQKAALEALLSKVKVMLQKTTKTGNEIGRFYADAVTELKALYNDALKAVEKNDTSVHSYAEWNSVINEEITKLNSNPEARATLRAGDVYNFINAEYRSYLTDDAMGLKSVSGNGSDTSRRWLIDAVAYDGTFVIKNKNGEYINDVELNTGAMCSGENYETAVVFNVTYNDNATLYLTTADGEEMHLTVNGDGYVTGSKELVDGSLWNVVRVEKGETAIEEVEAEDGDNIVYDLLGRKVTEPAKGIYIKNGKATVIK